MTVSVRAYREDDWARFRWLDELAFGYTSPDDDSPDTRILDHDRSLIAELDGEPVGIASAYGFGLSVPGGALVPTAGTTWVGVVPTHRRRGVLRAMMLRHLRDSVDRGDVLAALWATGPGIYGRFGYGVAARALRLSVTADHLARAPHDPALRVTLARPGDVRDDMESVYDRAAAVRPGATARDSRWWDRTVYDPEHRRDGGSEKRAVVVSDEGGVRGHAIYATTLTWSGPGTPDGTVSVRELVALDAPARAALWQVLLGHDLMSRTEWFNAPSDEPLLDWVHDRGAVRGLTDQLYVRLLDLPAALRARTYRRDVDLVVEVHDDLVAANSGRWHLHAAAGGAARCDPTERAPDLSIDVRDLAAAYLGSRTLDALARAGLAQVHDAARLDAASDAFRHAPAAWCPAVF